MYSIETLLGNNNGYYHRINSLDIYLDEEYKEHKEDMRQMLLYSYLSVDDFKSLIKPFEYSLKEYGVRKVVDDYLQESASILKKLKDKRKDSLKYCGFCFLKELSDEELNSRIKRYILPKINSLVMGRMYVYIYDNVTEHQYESYLTKKSEDYICEMIKDTLKEELQEVDDDVKEYFKRNHISPSIYCVESNGLVTADGIYASFSDMIEKEMKLVDKESRMKEFLSRW